MAKRARKNKAPEMTAEEIEADRLAAHKQDDELQANIDANFRVIELDSPDKVAEVHNAVAEALDEIDHITNDEVNAGRYHEERIDSNVEDEFGPAGKLGELEDDAEVEEEVKLPNSVVAEKFKLKYLENARAAGIAGKAAKRSNWDWLAQQIAMACLGEKDKIRIDDFMQLLDDNGVDYSRWTNRNKGWEGRFRMTGRVALQKVVANAGVLKVGMSEVLAPFEFVEKYRTKTDSKA
jgi:hypothetical protein